MERSITCINCPMGCLLTVSLEDGKVTKVEGHTCNKGVKYAELECTDPRRIVTSTVKVLKGDLKTLPVKTKDPIPKAQVYDCAKALKETTVTAPIKIGDVIYENVCNTGIDIVATRNVN